MDAKMVPNNPLNKYFRQPKLYISLPSKGLHYPPGVLAGDYNNVPIFGMTGMDELLMKTPDALFNGESSIKVIESCCPYIKDATQIPSVDVDTFLIAIRIATYGDKMAVSANCRNCGEESSYDISLQGLLEYFKNVNYNSVIQVSPEISVKIRPLTYKELTEFSIENFKLQRTLAQLPSLSEEERNQIIAGVYVSLGQIQVALFMTTIESVTTPDAVVHDKELIKEWLQNSDKEIYTTIKEHIETTKQQWDIPAQEVHCTNCSTDNKISVMIDQTSFFA